MRSTSATVGLPLAVSMRTSFGRLHPDPDQIRREMEAAFPSVRAWLGDYTGHWWALVNDRLVEAVTPQLLADEIHIVLGVVGHARRDDAGVMWTRW